LFGIISRFFASVLAPTETFRLNHIAFLVSFVEKAAAAFGKLDLFVGPAEIWDGEGTREIYIGAADCSASVLLMEPVKEGAYLRAMKKRGPGLHHIAVDVPDLESYIDGLSGSGWFLHPKSLQTIRKLKTAYPARPGIPALIEVHEAAVTAVSPRLIERIVLNLPARAAGMIDALGLSGVVQAGGDESVYFSNSRKIGLKEFLG